MSGNLQQQQQQQHEGERSSTASPSFDGWDNGSRGSLEPVSLEFFGGGSANASGSDYNLNFMAPSAAAADISVRDTSAEAVEETVAEVVFMDEQPQPPLKREAVEVSTFTRRRKKPKGMPKRSLSAYNIYFQHERQRIMDQQQATKKMSGSTGLSFEELGKMIGKRWRDLSAADREEYEVLASQDSVRYRKEMGVFNEEKKKRILHIDDGSKPEAASVFELTTNASTPLPSLQVPHEQQHVANMKYYAATGSLYAPSPDRTGPSPLHSRDTRQRHPSYPASDRHPTPPYPPVASAYSPMSRFPGVDLNTKRSGGSMPPQLPPDYDFPADGQHDRSDDGPGGRPPPVSRSSSTMHPPPMPSSMDQEQQHQCNDSFFPIPPGMELMLPDRDGRERKFRVEYACFTMTREAAQDYIDRLSGALSQRSTPPHPPPSYRRVGGNEESVASASTGYNSRARATPPQLSPNDRRRSWGDY